jgi:hypothetical protein
MGLGCQRPMELWRATCHGQRPDHGDSAQSGIGELGDGSPVDEAAVVGYWTQRLPGVGSQGGSNAHAGTYASGA